MGEAKRRKLAVQWSQLVSASPSLAPSRAITARRLAAALASVLPTPATVVAALLLAALSMGVSKVALAQCTTGSPCTVPAIPPPGYTSNINLGGNAADTLSLALDPGVIVNSPGGDAVNAANTTNNNPPSAPVTITANGTATNGITINNTGAGSNNSGLRIQSSGSATITATNTSIDLPLNSTGSSNNAIWAIVQGSNPVPIPNLPVSATVVWTGDHITTSGANTDNIQAENRGSGNASVDASGNMSLTGPQGGFSAIGIIARTCTTLGGGTGCSVNGAGNPGNTSNASVIYRSGTIDVRGASFSGDILANTANTNNPGTATVTTLPGTTLRVSAQYPTDIAQQAIVVFGFGTGGAGIANVASTIQVNGNPTAAAPPADFRSQPIGILNQSVLADVEYTGPGITVHGGGGIGIAASTTNNSNAGIASGSATVNASGPINADGSDAIGILADSGGLRGTMTGPVQVMANEVSATGQFGTAISANGGNGNVTVTIPSGGSIMGGWQADRFTTPNPTDGSTPPLPPGSLLPGTPPVSPPGNISSISGLPAAGIFLSANGGGTATLDNEGSIGALSDLAIVGDPIVTNNGTITGFVQFAGDNNSIVNNGTFDLRHFAETIGNADGTATGVRDTLRVAVADLGNGTGNTFTNNGTLALPEVTGVTKPPDTTGQYLPIGNVTLGNPNNAMALNGPLQGQLIGVETFTNSGIIDLTANPVPGDVLMITGGRGGSTPGTGGGGTFISNGGSLFLDTVLNQGGAATLSDTLVVDGTAVGPNGATKTFIHNAGGAGAETVGDGILVVEVLDQARSADGAFTLGNSELRAGAFRYGLFHGGVDGSNPGDWFLRNVFETPEPGPGPGGEPPPTEEVEVPPAPGPVPPGPDAPFPEDPPPSVLPPETTFPIIGPELATYGVVQPLARQLGLTQLGTLHERIGDTLTVGNGGDDAEGYARSAWGRVIGQTINNRYEAFADPRADGHIVGMQAGLDLLRASFQPGHRDVAGLYFSYLNANAGVDGLVTNPAATAYVLQHTGTVNLNAYSGGAYWTHYGPGDWYLDGVLQGTGYTGNATTQFANLSTDGSGFIASLEGGYPIPLPQLGPNFILEPQAQIIWQHVSFDQANDGLGTIGLGSTSGTTGRLGVRGQWTIPDANGVVWQPYGRFNVWQDWGGKAETSFSGEDVPLLNRATRLEFAGGLTYKLQPNLSFYAQAGYEFAVSPSNVQRDGFKGDVGLRYTW